MDIAFSGSERPTVAIVSANFEAANVLKSYANDSSAGYEYRLHTTVALGHLARLFLAIYPTTRSPRITADLTKISATGWGHADSRLEYWSVNMHNSIVLEC